MTACKVWYKRCRKGVGLLPGPHDCSSAFFGGGHTRCQYICSKDQMIGIVQSSVALTAFRTHILLGKTPVAQWFTKEDSRDLLSGRNPGIWYTCASRARHAEEQTRTRMCDQMLTIIIIPLLLLIVCAFVSALVLKHRCMVHDLVSTLTYRTTFTGAAV